MFEIGENVIVERFGGRMATAKIVEDLKGPLVRVRFPSGTKQNVSRNRVYRPNKKCSNEKTSS